MQNLLAKWRALSLHWSVATAFILSSVSILVIVGAALPQVPSLITNGPLLQSSPDSTQISASESPSPEATGTPSPSPSSSAVKKSTKNSGSTSTTATATPANTAGTTSSETIAYLIGAGDIATCANDFDEATADILDDYPSDTVFTLGDNAYENGSATDFANCYNPTWGRHKARTKPSAGNHDYNTANATGYYNYFGSLAGEASKGYYSYNLGDWHIIVLNSNSNCSTISCSAGSAQEWWLRADLAANTGTRCTLAYWHHPRFNSGASHGNNTNVQPFWQALYDYDADVVLSGHEHIYERFAPQTPVGVADSARGIREFIVGTGGRELYSIGTIKANSEVRDSASNGILRLTLKSTSYSWNFIPAAGSTFTDSGTADCH